MIVGEFDELDYPTGLRDAVRSRVRAQKVCVEGIGRATSGNELMSRWWAWRHRADEYEDCAGLQAARVAIRRFSTALPLYREERNPGLGIGRYLRQVNFGVGSYVNRAFVDVQGSPFTL